MSHRRVRCKEVRETIALLERYGWEEHRWTGGGHIELRHPPTGAVVFVAGTPSHSARRAVLADAQRAIRRAMERR